MLRVKHILGLIGAVALIFSMSAPALASTSGTATVGGSVGATLTLTITDGSVDFTGVSPDGATVLGTTNAVDTNGACYLTDGSGANQNTAGWIVKSNKSYDGSASVAQGSSHTAGLDPQTKLKDAGVAQGTTVNTSAFLGGNNALDYADCTSASPVNGSNWVSSASATAGQPYTAAFALQVDWLDAPGTIDIVITYQATQLP